MSKVSFWIGLVFVMADAAPLWAGDAAPVPRSGGTMAAQCRVAYREQELPFLLANCPEEAWALARAQCEREPDKVKPAYVDFCGRFYNGTAPSYGTVDK